MLMKIIIINIMIQKIINNKNEYAYAKNNSNVN